MKDIQGMPGTPGGLALRFFQFVFTVASLCVMASTIDFASVIAFCYLVAAVILQSFWSLTLALCPSGEAVFEELSDSQFVHNLRRDHFHTLAAACASAGITVLIGNDLGECVQNHCTKFETATAMAVWFAVSLSFLINFWSSASR